MNSAELELQPPQAHERAGELVKSLAAWHEQKQGQHGRRQPACSFSQGDPLLGSRLFPERPVDGKISARALFPARSAFVLVIFLLFLLLSLREQFLIDFFEGVELF